LKNYLSFGGGVNSVAMMLNLLDEGWDFEAVFVDHGTDWPETYEYLDMFQEWLQKNKHEPITILKPNVQGFNNLYDYFYHYEMVPLFQYRICSDKFKVRVLYKYFERPCFSLIGFDIGETKRAKVTHIKQIENRFPLIEAKIDRWGCKEIIKKHDLPVPMKSGCYICPFQKRGQWIELRYKHPRLFQKAVDLEQRKYNYSKRNNKPLHGISPTGARLQSLVDENQYKLFKQDEYPAM